VSWRVRSEASDFCFSCALVRSGAAEYVNSIVLGVILWRACLVAFFLSAAPGKLAGLRSFEFVLGEFSRREAC
jgi:hypothetical protein